LLYKCGFEYENIGSLGIGFTRRIHSNEYLKSFNQALSRARIHGKREDDAINGVTYREHGGPAG
jgi:hypothetical protein